MRLKEYDSLLSEAQRSCPCRRQIYAALEQATKEEPKLTCLKISSGAAWGIAPKIVSTKCSDRIAGEAKETRDAYDFAYSKGLVFIHYRTKEYPVIRDNGEHTVVKDQWLELRIGVDELILAVGGMYVFTTKDPTAYDRAIEHIREASRDHGKPESLIIEIFDKFIDKIVHTNPNS